MLILSFYIVLEVPMQARQNISDLTQAGDVISKAEILVTSKYKIVDHLCHME